MSPAPGSSTGLTTCHQLLTSRTLWECRVAFPVLPGCSGLGVADYHAVANVTASLGAGPCGTLRGPRFDVVSVSPFDRGERRDFGSERNMRRPLGLRRFRADVGMVIVDERRWKFRFLAVLTLDLFGPWGSGPLGPPVGGPWFPWPGHSWGSLPFAPIMVGGQGASPVSVLQVCLPLI